MMWGMELMGFIAKTLPHSMGTPNSGTPLPFQPTLVLLLQTFSDALAQILDVQRLCSTDIHAVHAQYQALLDAASPEVREQGTLPPTPALEAALSLLRGYLTSCTARDCALLLALRRESSGGGPTRPQTAEAPGRVTLHGGGAVFYRLTVIDLDRKPVSKLARHLALDAEIMRVAGGIEPAADHDLE